MSLCESFVQPAVGLLISWSITMLIFPLYGYEITGGSALSMNLIFFAASLVRSYIIRRVFNNFGRI